jgi:hypothetical protein
MPSWHGSWLKHRDNFTLPYSVKVWSVVMVQDRAEKWTFVNMVRSNKFLTNVAEMKYLTAETNQHFIHVRVKNILYSDNTCYQIGIYFS